MRVKRNVCVFTIRLNANEQLELYFKSLESIGCLAVRGREVRERERERVLNMRGDGGRGETKINRSQNGNQLYTLQHHGNHFFELYDFLFRYKIDALAYIIH